MQKITEQSTKVLVVDDNDINRIVIIAMVNKCGDYKIFEAINGQEAVEQYEKEKPQYVLMDVQMPVMNGFDAIKHIREIETESKVKAKIIIVTAHATEEDKLKCLDMGIDYYLSKPFTTTDIQDVLN